MTLWRLIGAWFLVVVWFGVATFAWSIILAKMLGHNVLIMGRELRWRLIEAALLTLLGSLWFDSLGSGEWWLLFALIGSLATLPLWVLGPSSFPKKAIVAGALTDVARYVGAGALLAWALS